MSDNAALESQPHNILSMLLQRCIRTNNSLNPKQCLCPRRVDHSRGTFVTLGMALRGPFVSVGVKRKRKGLFVRFISNGTDNGCDTWGSLLVPTAECRLDKKIQIWCF